MFTISTKMKLFLLYDLSKIIVITLFLLHYFTTGNQNCLFVSKKDETFFYTLRCIKMFRP